MTPEERAEKIRQLKRRDKIRALKARDAAAQPEGSLNPDMWRKASDVALEGIAGAGTGIEGLADLVTLPINLAQRGYAGVKNLMDEDPDTGFWAGAGETPGMGELTRDIMSPVTGVTDYQTIPEGVDPTLDKVKRFTKHALPIAVTGLPGALKKAPALLKQAGTAIGGAAVGSGTGAVVGHELGGEKGEMIGSIAGGIAGDVKGIVNMFGTIYRGGKAGYKRLGRMKSEVNLDTATDAEISGAIRQYLAHAYEPGSPQMTKEYYDRLYTTLKQANAAGKKGSVAQRTGDVGLRQFETHDRSGMARANRSDLDIHDAELNKIAREAVTGVEPAGKARGAGALPKSQVAAGKRGVDTQMRQDAAVSQRALDVAEGKQRLTQTQLNKQAFERANPTDAPLTGTNIEKAVTLKKAVTKQYDDAWATAKRPNKGVTDNMVRSLDSIAEQVNPTEANIYASLKATITKLADKGSDVSLKNLDRTISTLRGKHVKGSQVSEVLGNMQDTFRAGLTPEGQRMLKAADRNYPDYLTVKAAGAKAFSEGEEFTAKQLSGRAANVARERGFTGEAPMQDLTRKGTAEAAMRKSETATARALRNKTRVTPSKLVTAQGKLDTTPTGKFAQWGASKHKASKAAKETMAAKNSVTAMQDVLHGATGQNRKNIRKAFIQNIRDTHMPGKTLSKKALADFRESSQDYIDAGMFTKKEIKSIEAGMVEGNKMYLGVDKAKLAAIPPERKRVQEGVAALLGAKIGANLFGSPLIGAAIGRKTARDIFDRMTTEKTQKLAYELAMNPDKFVDIVERVNKASQQGALTYRTGQQFLADFAVRAGVTLGMEHERE